MLIKVDVKSDLYDKIQKLIQDGKYADFYQFISIALQNQIEEEKSSFGEERKSQVETTRKSIPQILHESILEKQNELRSLLGEMPLEKSEIEPIEQHMIWNFYNRFFPIKIVVRQLAIMINAEKTWIELSELQENAFDYAEKISSELKVYEDDRQLSRNKKLSTGLPTPKSEIRGFKGAQRRKKEAKIIASKLRFMEQFVGKVIKKTSRSFKGACFEMGLMRVKFEGNSCMVTLTEEGNDFAILENPILDQEKFDSVFSSEETDFIMEKVIPKFQVEEIIVEKILERLKNDNLTSEEIDKIYEEEVEKFYSKIQGAKDDRKKILGTLTQDRIATMGRLSELKMVIWEIDSEGKSVYSLP